MEEPVALAAASMCRPCKTRHAFASAGGCPGFARRAPQVERLQRKFHSIHSTLVHGPSLASGPTSRAITDLEASMVLSSVASPPHMALQQQAGGRLLPTGGMAPVGRTPEVGP
jgi:hypothetical protein